MKRICLLAITASALVVSCENANEVAPVIEHHDGAYATIEQPDAFSTKGLSFNDGKVSFVWENGERLAVYGSSTYSVLTINDGGASVTKLDCPDFKLDTDVDYSVFSPVPGTLSDASKEAINVSFSDQRQTANTDTEHLRLNQYACATSTVDGNSINFQLYNQVAWIRYSHTFTEAVTGAKTVTISASEGEPFVLNGTIDATKPVSEKGFTTSITASNTASEITLNLGEESGNGIDIASGEVLNAFFTIHPVDLTGKTITFTVKDSDGKTVSIDQCTGRAIKRNAVVPFSDNSSKPAVATIDGEEYSTLNAAVAAATDGATIKLVSDVTTVKVPIGKSVTFDLDGNTVTADDDVFFVTEDGLTVNFTNGNIVSTKYGGLFFKQGLKDENITFDNCNITGVEGAIATSTLTGSSITINGGTFVSSNNAVILTNGNSREGDANTITINGGTFKGQMSDEAYNARNSIACGIYAAWKDNIIVNDGTFDIERGVGVLCRGGKVTIKGGTFTTTDPDDKTGRVGDSRIVVPCQTVYVDKDSKYPDYENATIEISGGSFSDYTCQNYIANGYGVAKKEDLYKVLKVQEATNQKTLKAAIEGADTESPAFVNNTIEITNQIGLASNNTLIIGENGKIIPSSSNKVTNIITTVISKGTMNLCGSGYIEATTTTRTEGSAAILLRGGDSANNDVTMNIYGNLTINGGSGSLKGNRAVRIDRGILNIYGGHFYSGLDKNNDPTQKVKVIQVSPATSKYTATLNIYDGVFECDGDPSAMISHAYSSQISRSHINIMGGVFVGFNPANVVQIDDTTTSYVPDGYESVEITYNGKQAWKVSKKR